MLLHLLYFLGGLTVLLLSAKFFTRAAENIGHYIKLPPFVVGVFIIGIGTSLPELVSAVVSVSKGVSEMVPGNIFGANVSNLLLLTGSVAALYRKEIVLSSRYIFIDLHFLIGGFFMLALIAYDGVIQWPEAMFGVAAFLIHSFYLLRHHDSEMQETKNKSVFPYRQILLLVITAAGIFIGAEKAVDNLHLLALDFSVPPSIAALTLLSIGTTLPELAVNYAVIKQGKPEMAIGNVLGSCVFNSMVIPGVAAFLGDISVPAGLISFSLPVMMAAGLLFYLLTHDKRISVWEGWLFVLLYALFIFKVVN